METGLVLPACTIFSGDARLGRMASKPRGFQHCYFIPAYFVIACAPVSTIPDHLFRESVINDFGNIADHTKIFLLSDYAIDRLRPTQTRHSLFTVADIS